MTESQWSMHQTRNDLVQGIINFSSSFGDESKKWVWSLLDEVKRYPKIQNDALSTRNYLLSRQKHIDSKIDAYLSRMAEQKRQDALEDMLRGMHRESMRNSIHSFVSLTNSIDPKVEVQMIDAQEYRPRMHRSECMDSPRMSGDIRKSPGGAINETRRVHSISSLRTVSLGDIATSEFTTIVESLESGIEASLASYDEQKMMAMSVHSKRFESLSQQAAKVPNWSNQAIGLIACALGLDVDGCIDIEGREQSAEAAVAVAAAAMNVCIGSGSRSGSRSRRGSDASTGYTLSESESRDHELGQDINQGVEGEDVDVDGSMISPTSTAPRLPAPI